MEAFYRFFLSLYISDKSSPSTDSPSQASGDITAVLASLVTSFSSITSDDELDAFQKKVDTQLSVQAAEFCFSDFHSFMDRLSQKQDTIRFWYQFVSTDILAYLGLFVGLRYRNWDLRTGSIKQLAAIFSAFDRPVYQRLIPTHIHDLLTLPKPLLEHLQQGCFSVRLTPGWQSMEVKGLIWKPYLGHHRHYQEPLSMPMGYHTREQRVPAPHTCNDDINILPLLSKNFLQGGFQIL